MTSIIDEAKKIEIVLPQKDNSVTGSMAFLASSIKNIDKEELSSFDSIKITTTSQVGNEILKNVKVVEEQVLTDKKVVYGFVEGFYKFYFLKGKKTNIQIVIEEEKAQIGLPIILTSF